MKAPAKHGPSGLTLYPLYKAKGVLRATVFQKARTLGDHWKPGHPRLEWEGLCAKNREDRQNWELYPLCPWEETSHLTPGATHLKHGGTKAPVVRNRPHSYGGQVGAGRSPKDQHWWEIVALVEDK